VPDEMIATDDQRPPRADVDRLPPSCPSSRLAGHCRIPPRSAKAAAKSMWAHQAWRSHAREWPTQTCVRCRTGISSATSRALRSAGRAPQRSPTASSMPSEPRRARDPRRARHAELRPGDLRGDEIGVSRYTWLAAPDRRPSLLLGRRARASWWTCPGYTTPGCCFDCCCPSD